MREFDRTGAIEKSIGVTHEGGGGAAELDAHAMVTRLLAGIADGRAGFHGALTLNGAGARENGFKQRGLAALERAHQRDALGTRGTCTVPVPYRHEHLPVMQGAGRRGSGQTPEEPSFQEARGMGK